MNQIEKIRMQVAISAQPLRLSIGLPVFNGEQYLAKTLDSLLAQTFTGFELIISDNASTDTTRQICEAYAARDPRIRYYRNPKNIGAMQNWYRVFELSSSEYFASIAHDDIYDPDYMRRCVEILENDPSVVACYSKTAAIDAQGEFLYHIDVHVDTMSPYANGRLYQAIAVDYFCIQLYGVMRTDILRKVGKFTGYYGSDRNILAELCLLGRLYEIPEYLFHHRLYENALGVAMNSGKSVAELSVLDPGTNWTYRSSFLTIYRNYFRSVARLIGSPLERLKCYLQLERLIVQKVLKRVRRSLGGG